MSSILIILGAWFGASAIGGILFGRFVARTQNPCVETDTVDLDATRTKRPNYPLRPEPVHVSTRDD